MGEYEQRIEWRRRHELPRFRDNSRLRAMTVATFYRQQCEFLGRGRLPCAVPGKPVVGNCRCTFLQLNSSYCEFTNPARTSRRWMLNHAVERHSIYFSSHFPETSAGRVGRVGDEFACSYIRERQPENNVDILNTTELAPEASTFAEDLVIDSDTPNIRLHLRHKGLASRTVFPAAKTLLMMHGATYVAVNVRLPGGLSTRSRGRIGASRLIMFGGNKSRLSVSYPNA
jgi:hypothetical protein